MAVTPLSPVSSDALTSLDTQLTGEAIAYEHPDYDRARRVWNGMIDRRPALIARCADPADVVACVNFARVRELPLAVRGGGHGVAGHALCDAGLVIDLSRMKWIEIDPDARTARAQGGCTLGELDRETQRRGLAAPLGVVSRTGIAGLTLSGGMGWLRRKHGLSCDNLISAQIVTADGRLVTASDDENADLFWAIRGGGGNFGVVTSFEYRLHPVGPEVFVCFVLYPAERACAVLRFCERYLDDAPQELAPIAILGRVSNAGDFPPEARGQPYVGLLAPYAGDAAEGERVVQPLRELGEPIADLSDVMSWTEAQAMLDDDYPVGWRYYWKSVNVHELRDEVIERLIQLAAAAPSPYSTIDVWYQGGAIARIGEQATAFANRSEPYLLGIEGNSEAGAAAEENVAWVRETFADMRSLCGRGVYLNFPGFLEEGEELLREGYGTNYERLRELKSKYDPTNVFRLNANIEPMKGGR